VLLAVWTRLAHVSGQHAGLRAPVTALAVITPIGLAIFTLAGPLQQGWARRAGTPASLLGRRTASSASSGRTVRPAAGSRSLPASFTATLGGTMSEAQEPGGAVVNLAMRVSGQVRGRLRVRIGGVPVGAGAGLSMTGSQVDLALAGRPSVLQGQIASLQGEQFDARLSDAAGTRVDAHVQLQIDNQTNAVTGILSGSRVS